MKKLVLVLALVLATSVGLSATAIASAQRTHAQPVAASKGKGHGTVHGVVAAVDTTASTITLTVQKSCDTAVISVTDKTKIRVNGKAGTLGDIQTGYRAVVKLAKDGSAKRIHARAAHTRHVLHGKVTGVDTTANTLTLQLRKTCESLTVNVTDKTKIRVNGKKGSLSDIQVGYKAYVKLAKDGTAKRIQARAPKA
jgi:hypothetical protein